MRISILLVIALALVSLLLAAENVEGILVDKMCSSKIVEKGYGAAKMHTKMYTTSLCKRLGQRARLRCRSSSYCF